MSKIEVTCKCGMVISSNDKNVLTAAARAHDAICPELFKPGLDLTIGGDDYLAQVERQRAEALATIERVNALCDTHEHAGIDVLVATIKAALKGTP